MVPLLSKDRRKTLWGKVAEAEETNAENDIVDIVVALQSDEHIQQLGSIPHSQEDLTDMLEASRACRKGKACNRWLDNYQRALEIVKQVELDSWDGLKTAGIYALLKKRILSSIAVPVNGRVPALEDSTVDTMIHKCFQIDDTEAKAAEPWK